LIYFWTPKWPNNNSNTRGGKTDDIRKSKPHVEEALMRVWEVMLMAGKCGIVTTPRGVGVIVRLPLGAGIRTVPLSSQEATVKEVTEKLTGQLKINGKLYVKVDNEAPRALKASEVLAKDACYYFYPLP
jgi:hypothetical protein